MEDKNKPYDKEKVYDEIISPLMKEVMALCKEHGVELVASFLLRDNIEGQNPLFCTTVIIYGDNQILYDMYHVALKNHVAVDPKKLKAYIEQLKEGQGETQKPESESKKRKMS